MGLGADDRGLPVHGFELIHDFGRRFEKAALVGVGPCAPAASTGGVRLGRLKPADEALKFGARETAAATDVYRVEVP